MELQPKLLRVLQEQEFERLGSSRTVRTDVRLIAATNCDLRQTVAEKKFRSDLYYRLNVFPIQVPPLRDRAEDIPLLVSYLAQKHARRMNKRIETIPTDALQSLCRYKAPARRGRRLSRRRGGSGGRSRRAAGPQAVISASEVNRRT